MMSLEPTGRDPPSKSDGGFNLYKGPYNLPEEDYTRPPHALPAKPRPSAKSWNKPSQPLVARHHPLLTEELSTLDEGSMDTFTYQNGMHGDPNGIESRPGHVAGDFDSFPHNPFVQGNAPNMEELKKRKRPSKVAAKSKSMQKKRGGGNSRATARSSSKRRDQANGKGDRSLGHSPDGEESTASEGSYEAHPYYEAYPRREGEDFTPPQYRPQTQIPQQHPESNSAAGEDAEDVSHRVQPTARSYERSASAGTSSVATTAFSGPPTCSPEHSVDDDADDDRDDDVGGPGRADRRKNDGGSWNSLRPPPRPPTSVNASFFSGSHKSDPTSGRSSRA